MNTLRDYVEWGITHSDKTGSAEGVPLVLENCVKDKKMKQLEVYGQSVQNGTPSPEAPVEVESVGEPCIKNWFEKNNFLSRDGYNVATNYSFYKAKYIEGLKPNTKYNVVIERLNGTKPTSAKCTVLLSGSTFSVGAGEYTTIGHASNATETNSSPYTSDANGRLTIGIATSTTQEQLDSLWKNTNVYLYEDGDETTVYKVPIVVKGKNLFKPTGVSGDGIGGDGKLKLKGSYGTTIDSTDFSDNKVVVTQVPDESYNTAAYQNGYICFLIPELTLGKTYELSFDVNITDNPLNADYLVCYACTYSILRVVLSSGTRCKTTFQYKTPNGGKPPCVEIRCGGASFELSNVMITEEGQDDTYEPYVEPQTTNVYLNEPLRRFGDYTDYIDFKNKKVIRKMYEYAIKGTEKWTWLNTADPNLWGFILATNDAKIDYMANQYTNLCTLCNYYPLVYSSKRADKTLSGNTALSNRFDFIDLDFATVDEWKAHLQNLYAEGNPIKVVYATKNNREESIDCDLPILTAKTSIIEINTSVAPSNIKGKYIKR